MTRINGYVIYDGPNTWNGRRIVSIIVCGSTNAKTGNMDQLYVLPAVDNPHRDARRTTSACCGNCRNRGNPPGTRRPCYVSIFRGPRAVWNHWKKGGYVNNHILPDCSLRQYLIDRPNKPLRIGAYGDPAMLPAYHLAALTLHRPWTGYTHAWKWCDQRMAMFLMASTHSISETILANKAGWRAFLSLPLNQPDPDPRIPWLTPCPSIGGAHCIACNLCNGTDHDRRSTSNNIWIRAHGVGAKYLRD